MGSLSGLLGVGGAVIGIPTLLWLFSRQGMPASLDMHMAEGTSLAVVFVTSLIGFLTHRLHQIPIWPIYRRLFVGILLGTLVGVIAAHHLSDFQLQRVFGVFILVLGLYTWLSNPMSSQRELPHWPYLLIFSLGIGVTSGLLGLGGGILIIPLLVFYQVPLRTALAVSLSCACTVSFFGTLLFIVLGMQQMDLPAWTSGYVYWPAFIGLALTSPLFAYWGVSLAHHYIYPAIRH